MKPTTNAILLLAVAFSCLSYGQTGCSNTVSVMSPDSKNIYLETVYDSKGNITSSNGAIPWDTPVNFRISSSCDAAAYFLLPELEGDYDTYESGSAISGNDNRLVGFTTMLTNPSGDDVPEITLKMSVGGAISAMKMVTTPAIPPPPPAVCVDYVIRSCCDMDCVLFDRLDTSCHACYKVYVKYADGTTGAFPISFIAGETVMNCVGKKVVAILAIVAVECKQSAFERKAPDAVSDDDPKRITLYPNPSQSDIYFEGEGLNDYKISVFDTNGRNIIKEQPVDHPVSISSYAPGIYFYIITDEKGYSQSGKIVRN